MSLLKQDDLAKLILRVALGAMIFMHGIAKIAHPEALGYIKGLLLSHGVPEQIVYGVYVGEIVAPVMIVLGYFSRIGGLLIAGNMLFVFWLAHMRQLFELSAHGGWALELQGFYLATGLAVMFLGSGKYAIKPD